jgi:hypothetical protein
MSHRKLVIKMAEEIDKFANKNNTHILMRRLLGNAKD